MGDLEVVELLDDQPSPSRGSKVDSLPSGDEDGDKLTHSLARGLPLADHPVFRISPSSRR